MPTGKITTKVDIMANGIGGTGGTPDGNAGQNGTIGTNDYSSTYGGAGASTPFGNGGQTPPLEDATGRPGWIPYGMIPGTLVADFPPAGNTVDKTIAPVTNGAWCGFLNTYGVTAAPTVGVWDAITFVTYAIPASTYTITASGDNHIRVYIDSVLVLVNDDYRTTNTNSITLTSGLQTIVCEVLNDGGPTGFAVAITDSAGGTVWHTRYPLSAPITGGQIGGGGGSGGSAWDRHGQLSWAGGAGAAGLIKISW